MVILMNDEKEKSGECKMTTSDAEGNVNLCFCYIIDSDARYEDPCYFPVNDCFQYRD